MGSWRRVGAFLGLVPENDDSIDYDDRYDDRYDEADYRGGYDDPGPAPVAPRGEWSAPSRRGTPASAPIEPVAAATHGALAMQLDPAPRPAVAGTNTASRPQTVKLTGFAEARVVGERFRDGASVILDMSELTDADARRVVDFAAGLAFALRGSIDKVTTRVFILLPPDADLSPADRRSYAGRFAAR